MSQSLSIPLATVGPTGDVLFSPHPAVLQLVIPEAWIAPTTEGDAVRVTLRLSVRAPVYEDDQRAFRQVLLQGRQMVMPSDVAAACLQRLEPAARGLPAASGEAWLAADEALFGPLRKAVAVTAYVSGFEVVGEGVQISAEVPAYSLRRAEQRRRELLAEAETRRLESARRAAGLLQELRESERSAAELLSRLPAEEGQAVLLAALGNESSDPAWVGCVAGGALVGVRPPGKDESLPDPVVIPLPGTLGPPRSIVALPGELLVGARDGIWRMDRPGWGVGSVSLPAAMELRDEPMPAEHGFTVVIRSGTLLFAAHRQRGLVWWEPTSGTAPRGALRPVQPTLQSPARPPPLPGAQRPPDVSVLQTVQATVGEVGRGVAGVFSAVWPSADGHGVVAASDRLERIRPDGSREFLSGLTCRCLLLAEADGLLAAVGEDGVIRLFDPLTVRPVGEVAVGEPVSSAAAMPWSGGTRLLCATQAGGGGGVVAVGVADPVVLRYASAHRGLREVAGGGGLVAAVSPDRMRLVLWHAWEPRRPAGEVHIGALVRGRIADVCVAG